METANDYSTENLPSIIAERFSRKDWDFNNLQL